MNRRASVRGFGMLAAVVLASATPAWAQFSPVAGREYREFFNPVTPVRGEAVLGMAVVPSTADATKGATIEVWVPDRFSGEVQVETLTADGRFRGTGAYVGASAGGQWVPLPLKPANPEGPASRPGTPQTLAVAVRTPSGELLLARWGGSPTPTPARMRLYVNGRRADMFVRAGANVIRCAPVEVAQPLRFDAYCDVPVGDVPADGGLVLIRRDQSDEQTQRVIVNVRGLR
jgi:hypothetical protein